MFATTVDSNHLPLELWYMAWGDMETCCPEFPSRIHCSTALETLPVGNLKIPTPLGADCVQWPIQARHKGLASGHVRTTLKGHLHSRHNMESAKVIWSVIQLNVFLCPNLSSLILQMLSLRAPLIHVPTLKSVWVCIPENRSVLH